MFFVRVPRFFIAPRYSAERNHSLVTSWKRSGCSQRSWKASIRHPFDGFHFGSKWDQWDLEISGDSWKGKGDKLWLCYGLAPNLRVLLIQGFCSSKAIHGNGLATLIRLDEKTSDSSVTGPAIPCLLEAVEELNARWLNIERQIRMHLKPQIGISQVVRITDRLDLEGFSLVDGSISRSSS